MGRPLKCVRKNKVAIAVFRNVSEKSGKPYLTMKVEKGHMNRQHEWIKDYFFIDRKELTELIWVLDQANDWINSHM